MDEEKLAAALDAYPRLPLATYPTPLEFLPRLSLVLERPVYIKRDDEIGPAMGGSKTRPLEYLLAEARQLGARKVVTFGGLQSNHARITAGACRQYGLEPHLLYFERRPTRLTGNLHLCAVLGARLHFVPLGGGGGMTLETANRLARLVALALVGPHYFIPLGGHSWRGCLGYVRAALELDLQARAVGIEDAGLVVPVGSGGTLAGLLAGFALIGSLLGPVGIDVGKLWRAFPASIGRTATELCRRLGQPLAFAADCVPVIEGAYAGQAYAVPSKEGTAALRRLAWNEAIILDPVYTGKAFGALLDLAKRGKWRSGQPVIFLHTGGTPALFAYEAQVIATRKGQGRAQA